MRKSQRLLSLLLAAVLLLGLLPASALGANTTPRVHVTVENTTYTEANAASDWIAPGMERPAAQRMGAARRDDDHDELHRLGAKSAGHQPSVRTRAIFRRSTVWPRSGTANIPAGWAH